MSDETAVNRELERELAEPFNFAWRESNHAILDSIAGNLHNKGYSLQGNTEESDIRWLARAMWVRSTGDLASPNQFDDQHESTRKEWIKNAEIAVKCLPALMGRIAHRVILMSQALRGMERAIRVEKKGKP